MTISRSVIVKLFGLVGPCHFFTMSSAQSPCLADRISTPGVWPAAYYLAVLQQIIQSPSRIHIINISQMGSSTLVLPTPATKSKPTISAPLEIELTSPAEFYLSVDRNWSNLSSDQDQFYPSHSQYHQYNPSASCRSSSNQPQYLQQLHLQYHSLHRLGPKHIEYPLHPPTSGTCIHYTPPARPSNRSNNTLSLEFYEQTNQHLPIPTHSSQAHIEQSSASLSSSHGSLSTFPAAPTRHLFEDAGPYLRETLHIPAHKKIDLWALPDPLKGEKPNQPYPILIKLAIYGSPNKQLTLQEIYTVLEGRFEWFKFRRNEKAWKVDFVLTPHLFRLMTMHRTQFAITFL
jgi:Forkhead domain